VFSPLGASLGPLDPLAATDSGSGFTETLSVTGRPSRSTVTVCGLPISERSTTSWSDRGPSTGVPLKLVTTSSSCMPAAAAGEPSMTSVTSTPFFPAMPSLVAVSSSSGPIETPRYPRSTVPLAMSWPLTHLARLTGIAKPIPW